MIFAYITLGVISTYAMASIGIIGGYILYDTLKDLKRGRKK